MPPIEPLTMGSAQQPDTRPHRAGVVCEHAGKMVLLHAFIKKTQKTPDADLELAMKRKKDIT
jgi:phage-related protein